MSTLFTNRRFISIDISLVNEFFISNNFIDLIEYGLIENEKSEIVKDFQAIKLSLIEQRELEMDLSHRFNILDLDPMSFLIPDFTKYFDAIKKNPYKYYPLNRELDSVILD